MKKVFLLDFNDSFSFNIVSYFYEKGLKVQTFNVEQTKSFLELLKMEKSPSIIIFGPGPGKPEDYKKFFPSLRKIMNIKKHFLCGICLGHQLIWYLKGHYVRKSIDPVHGQKKGLIIPPWEDYFKKIIWGQKVFVQRYNSLTVEKKNSGPGEEFALDGNGEIAMGRFLGGLTYQFHPESVGTTCPDLFLYPLVQILYNGHYESKTTNRRDLRFENINKSKRTRNK